MYYRYDVTAGLRRKGEIAGNYEELELSSENFDSLEDFCQAIAEEILAIIEEDEEDGE